ncbi:SpoIID/LytB domain-containing protein [Microbacter margulisiae]|uniref:SpoIID/LytB domain protein n=1 Tax=Microbacter margulisiae TaxID=1350067 RepID=A0A7W5DR28_9PORP|nr:SpoIID/LytB domain-containing protein [Microbacter margulisiae]MBB3187527.1 SpoIID/LytB domain protein [Microbacter margulisiae]
MSEPIVNVGILEQPVLEFAFHGDFECLSTENKVYGKSRASFRDGKIEWEGALYNELVFAPVSDSTSFFEIKNVIIGINFHWERKEDQQFKGGLKIVTDGDKLVAINQIGVETYLTSVISSEMSATSSLELLKAHAVISRSWLLAQIEKAKEMQTQAVHYDACVRTEESLIRWYDREDHTLFDVCADDHCQRYQGMTRQNKVVAQAVEATWGEILEYDGKICDARFSKSCGGITELFENCWEPVSHPYLTVLRDVADEDKMTDLTVEANAEQWIRSAPTAFCNTNDPDILNQVLNNYDQETTDFYRWTVLYSQEEISQLITRRTGIDFGVILELIPVERGTSGRLIRLKIIGSKKTLIIGKELEIRKALSTSHLYSSAFVVDTFDRVDGVPQRFVLTGAGWGHGVGLCQIGAAVMGAKGYTYNDILLHYFRGASLVKKY